MVGPDPLWVIEEFNSFLVSILKALTVTVWVTVEPEELELALLFEIVELFKEKYEDDEEEAFTREDEDAVSDFNEIVPVEDVDVVEEERIEEFEGIRGKPFYVEEVDG